MDRDSLPFTSCDMPGRGIGWRGKQPDPHGEHRCGKKLAAMATWQLVHPYVNRMSEGKVEMVLADFAKKFLRLPGNLLCACLDACPPGQWAADLDGQRLLEHGQRAFYVVEWVAAKDGQLCYVGRDCDVAVAVAGQLGDDFAQRGVLREEDAARPGFTRRIGWCGRFQVLCGEARLLAGSDCGAGDACGRGDLHRAFVHGQLGVAFIVQAHVEARAQGTQAAVGRIDDKGAATRGVLIIGSSLDEDFTGVQAQPAQASVVFLIEGAGTAEPHLSAIRQVDFAPLAGGSTIVRAPGHEGIHCARPLPDSPAEHPACTGHDGCAQYDPAPGELVLGYLQGIRSQARRGMGLQGLEALADSIDERPGGTVILSAGQPVLPLRAVGIGGRSGLQQRKPRSGLLHGLMRGHGRVLARG